VRSNPATSVDRETTSSYPLGKGMENPDSTETQPGQVPLKGVPRLRDVNAGGDAGGNIPRNVTNQDWSLVENQPSVTLAMRTVTLASNDEGPGDQTTFHEASPARLLAAEMFHFRASPRTDPV
jgi:hypothetical protein